MINQNNYFSEIQNIDTNNLPEALKESYDTIKFGSKDHSTWQYLQDDKEFLKLYFDKLNSFIDANNKEIKKQSKSKPVVKKKTTTKANTKVNTKKTTKSSRKKTKSTQKTAKKSSISAKKVEKLPEEIRFIKRYVLLNGKVKTKHQILLFINALQKAILEKRIRKSSEYAKEIMHIQKKLIELYNKIPEQVEVSISDNSLKKFSKIADSEKVLLSIRYLKRFIGLQGKKPDKTKAKRLFTQLRNAVDKGKLTVKDPYKEKLEYIYRALNDYIEGKTNSPVIDKAELNGLMGLVDKPLFKKSLKTTDSLSGVPGVMSSVALSQMNFETIGLTGKYEELIGDPSVGFSCMVYGKPKSGKSTMCIDFAKHLAKNHGKVLYAAIEEGFGYTTKEKLERLNAVDKNLFIGEKIPDKLGMFDFVFIDSVSKGKVDNEKLNELINANPKTAFIFIFHATKEGDFRGGQENAHDVDCIIEVKEGIATGKGRFGVGGKLEVFG